jgi:TRAP-type C4-dicarboxylate transport system substrate-binding protein
MLNWISIVSLLCITNVFALDLRFGTIAPSGTPWAQSLEDIKIRVEKESAGKIKIKNFLGGQIGGELEILQKVRRGQIQGAGLTCGAMASVIPELDLLEIPYLFENSAEADFVLDQYLFPKFQQIFEAKGLILLTWAENGWRSIGHKSKFIKKPSDLKGEKIRSQESKVHLAFWKKMMAAPQAISTPEVLPALQTGVVQAFDNTPLFTLAAEWQSAIKFYSVTNHIFQPGVVVYSKKFWDKLSAEDKKILTGPGNAQAIGLRQSVRELGYGLLNVLKEQGIQVYHLSESEKAEFKKSLSGFDQEIIKSIGGQANEIYQLIQQGKAAFKGKK